MKEKRIKIKTAEDVMDAIKNSGSKDFITLDFKDLNQEDKAKALLPALEHFKKLRDKSPGFAEVAHILNDAGEIELESGRIFVKDKKTGKFKAVFGVEKNDS